MAENNEKAGGGSGGKDEAGGVWKGPEFRIHLQGKKIGDVQVRIVRKKELLITERDSMDLITRSKLPKRVSTKFTHFMKDGFLVVSFERLSFGRKVWKVLLGGAILVGAVFGCVTDVESMADRQRSGNDEVNIDDGQ